MRKKALFAIIMVLLTLTLLPTAPIACMQEGYDGVYFPLGDKSFADQVVDFRPGTGTGEIDGSAAIGPPDASNNTGPSVVGSKGDVSLGNGGSITIKFNDNWLIDVYGPDLYVFEYGPSTEPFRVEISEDGSNWIDLGTVGGQPAALDIHNKVAPDDEFSYVRITDANSTTGHPYAGADIDAVGAIGVESAPPGSAAIQLYPIADAYVNSTNPDMNYGSGTRLRIHFDSYTSYSYVMFDLSSIPSEARITSAYLTLYLTSVSGVGPFGVLKVGTHYCPDNSWTELGITWNNKPDFEPETAAVRSFGAIVWVGEYYSWNVTAHVTTALQQGRLTEGLKFEPYGEWGHHVFHSREGTSKPYLEVEYTIPSLTSAISCSVGPGEVEFGQTVNVSGGISPPHGGVEVTLTYTRPNGSLITRAVTTTAAGNYSDLITPDSIGSWSVYASWAGEGEYGGAKSPEASFTVTKASSSIYTFDVFLDDIHYPVSILSNSTVSNFNFNEMEMQTSFNVTGESGTTGYCNVTIPKSLLTGDPWTINIDNATITDFDEKTNDTHTFLYFTYTHESPLQVTIEGTWVVPEFPLTIILPLFMILSLITIVSVKLRKKKQ